MNALELAGSLEKHLGGWSYAFIFESATMLRHQQAEIEALKAMVARLTIEGGKEIGKAQEK